MLEKIERINTNRLCEQISPAKIIAFASVCKPLQNASCCFGAMNSVCKSLAIWIFKKHSPNYTIIYKI